MSEFTLSVKPLPNTLHNKFKWCLDSPRDGQKIESHLLVNNGLHISGWLLKNNGYKGSIIVIQGEQVTNLPLNRTREDVLNKVCINNETWFREANCGFNHTITLTTDSVLVGLLHESSFTPLYQIDVSGSFKVLEGNDGWLFLNNDTNDSVEQFKGKIKLSRLTRYEWKSYMLEFTEISTQNELNSVFIVAPSKEFVAAKFYPLDGPKNTPLDQLIKLKIDNFPLVTLVDVLRRAEHRTFRVCDTHWNAYGAMLASLEMAQSLGVNIEPARKTFSQDSYIIRETGGDLGSKLYPPRTHEESMLTNYNFRSKLVFDNQLPNFGRTMIIENEEAIYNKNILLFGSSSAYSMFNYLTRIFSCVVFVHSAGSVDSTLVSYLKPDFLAAQSNARFIVKAPSCNIQLGKLITQKTAKLHTTPSTIENSVKTAFAEKAKAFIKSLY